MPKSVEVVEKSTTLVPIVYARSPADPITQDSVAKIKMKDEVTQIRMKEQVNQGNIATPTKRASEKQVNQANIVTPTKRRS